jgi:hypothetical protein
MSGIAPLDALWQGMWPGSFDILGARSEHGKTALAMRIAENVARQLPPEDAGAAPAERGRGLHPAIFHWVTKGCRTSDAITHRHHAVIRLLIDIRYPRYLDVIHR